MGFDSGSCSLAGWVKKTTLLYFAYALLYHKVVKRILSLSLIVTSDLFFHFCFFVEKFLENQS